MMTVHEVSSRTGVSIRALHHYDKIGLLHPAEVSEAGYRLYDDTDLERLQCILFFKELQFSLKEIRQILDSPDFDRDQALEQQITLLEMKKEQLQNLIDLARKIKTIGVNHMDFTVFDTEKIDAYTKQAREFWGNTKAWHEFEEKSKGRTKEAEKNIVAGLMAVFSELGAKKDTDPADAAVQQLVKKLQDYICGHYYTCTNEILASLGTMYAAGGSMTQNIDAAGGAGTAAFACRAIQIYCSETEEKKNPESINDQ